MTPSKRSRRPGNPRLTTGASALAMIVLVITVLLYRNLSETTPPKTDSPGTGPAAWYQVYFSDPGGPNSDSLRGGPDQELAGAIEAARLSVDIAAYELNLWSVRDALIQAHRRGVQVRMVTDSDYVENEEVQQLKEAGIEVLGDRREALMHDKFVVIDGLEVWSGSMNLTVNDAYRNNNNLIRIRSSRLAEDYTAEFEEMFLDDQFGAGSPSNTPYPSLTVEGTHLEVYFSPDDGVASHLAALIRTAQQRVSFMAFSFTSDEIADAMLERAKVGVTVSGVFEATQVKANQGVEYDRMRKAGLDVHLDGNPRNMHHKVILIDGAIVITGSYNYSANAEKSNDENVLVIYNPDIAAQYTEEFDRLMSQAGK